MHTKTIISSLLLDALAHNDPFPIHGILSFLIVDRGYDTERIRHIGRKYFHLPELTISDLLMDFEKIYFH